jgi:uncharacterized membrane protein
MPDEEEKRKSVRLEVSPETHEAWTKFVQDSTEYSTLSGLIRSAVKREMEKSDRDDGPVNVNFEPVQIALHELTERVGGLEDEMRSLDLATDAATDERIKDMMHHVRELIPLVDADDGLPDYAGVELPPDERAKLSGTIKDVAEALREEARRAEEAEDDARDAFTGQVDVWDVERALERLSREVKRVKVTVEDGERRYYEVAR